MKSIGKPIEFSAEKLVKRLTGFNIKTLIERLIEFSIEKLSKSGLLLQSKL